MYPDHRRQTFHFRSDECVANRSVNTSEIATESLLVGRTGAMQRLTLCSIRERVKEQDIRSKSAMVLETGGGTGRLATSAQDNWLEFEYKISDLSPFYL